MTAVPPSGPVPAYAPPDPARVWAELVEERLANAPRRAVYASFAGFVALVLFQHLAALAFILAVASVFLGERYVWSRPGLAAPHSAFHPLTLWVLAQSAVFASLSAVLWLTGGADGKLLAAFYMAAGAMNALATLKNNRPLMLAGIAGVFIYPVGLPLFDFISSAPQWRLQALIPLLGVGTLTVFCGSVWRVLARNDQRRMVESTVAIAERALAENQARKQAQVLTLMERELRAPLDALRSATVELAAADLPPTAAMQVRTARDACEILTAAVADVTALADVESDDIRLKIEPVCVRDFALGVIDAWRAQAQAKSVEVFLDVAPDAPAWVELDPLRVRQVLHHLVCNAIAYTQSGGVRLKVQAGSGRGSDQAMLAFSVADTGPGMSEELLASMFEGAPRARIAAAAARGQGLGLAISARLAERMGGRLTARSAIGHGSLFNLIIPVLVINAPNAQHDAPVQAVSFSGLSVLVVDDSAASRRLLSVFLKGAASVLELSSNARAALAALERERFDVMICDLRMPEMDGFALTQAIRLSGRPYAQIPIVAFTAGAAPGDKERCLAIGMTAYLAKPATPAQLFEAIGQALGSGTPTQTAA